MTQEPRVGCGAVILDGDRILLVRRLKEPEAGCWGLPGGKIDWLEPVADAVVREIREELGIVIRRWRLLCIAELIDAATAQHWVAPIHLVEEYEGDPQVQEPEKHDGCAWFDLDALPPALTAATRAAVAALRSRNQQPCQ